MREQDVSQDQRLNATACRDNHKMVIHASNAQWEWEEALETWRNVKMLQLVPETTRSSVLEILPAAWTAELVLKDSSFQSQTDQDVTDQEKSAHAPKSMHQTVIPANNAHQDKSQINKETNASKLQSAMVTERSSVLYQTATNAEFAQITLFQMPLEEDVLDQSQFVDVPKDTQLMDMIASTAQTDPSEIHPRTTARDASHNNAPRETRSSHQENTASDVMSAHKDMSQMLEEMTASESSQNVAALNSMMNLVMFASHAQLTMLLPTKTKCVYQDNAQVSTKSLVELNNAMHAENAKRDLLQITWEEDVSDSLLPNAHVTRDSTIPDSDVSDAQLVPDHQSITEAVLMFNATKTKSSEMTYFAHNVNGAHQEPSQTHKEETVSLSQDQQSTLTVLLNVTNTQSST